METNRPAVVNRRQTYFSPIVHHLSIRQLQRLRCKSFTDYTAERTCFLEYTHTHIYRCQRVSCCVSVLATVAVWID